MTLEKLKLHWQQKLENVLQVDEKSDEFIKELTVLNWTALDKPTLTELEACLLQLVTLNTHYLKPILRMLLKKFLPDSEDLCKDKYASYYTYIHMIIQKVFVLVPMSSVLFMSLLRECFPYISLPSFRQACYVHHLLHMISYLPAQRKNILEIVISHLVKLDVHSPKEEILEAIEIMEQEEDGEMELDEDVESKPTGVRELKHEYANSLDCLMLMMYEYIHDVCHKEDKLQWEPTKELYQDLMNVFDKLILPTYACSHVQFLIYYVCSFHLSLCKNFVEFLWMKFLDPNTASVSRQACAAYIGSFLARSKTVSIGFISDCLKMMCQWIHQYIDSDGDASRTQVDVGLHGPFYAACQTVFYLFAFHHTQLVEIKDSVLILRNLNFQRMVTCRLNPLKVCLSSIVRNFASFARNYQVAYCYTVMEKNQRASLPVASNVSHWQATILNQLDSFFPFDPYLLPQSNKYILPNFNEYQKEEDEETSVCEIEEDDFLDAPLISPDAISTLPEFLVYSTSPGFKISPT